MQCCLKCSLWRRHRDACIQVDCRSYAVHRSYCLLQFSAHKRVRKQWESSVLFSEQSPQVRSQHRVRGRIFLEVTMHDPAHYATVKASVPIERVLVLRAREEINSQIISSKDAHFVYSLQTELQTSIHSCPWTEQSTVFVCTYRLSRCFSSWTRLYGPEIPRNMLSCESFHSTFCPLSSFSS
jgi:hypothetical protein